MSDWISVEDSSQEIPHLVDILVKTNEGELIANCCKGHLWNMPKAHQDAVVTDWKPLPPTSEQKGQSDE